MDLAELKSKKRAAQQAFGALPGIEGFGIGDDVIRVYVSSLSAATQLPADIHGVPLEVEVTGTITAAGDGDRHG